MQDCEHRAEVAARRASRSAAEMDELTVQLASSKRDLLSQSESSTSLHLQVERAREEHSKLVEELRNEVRGATVELTHALEDLEDQRRRLAESQVEVQRLTAKLGVARASASQLDQVRWSLQEERKLVLQLRSDGERLRQKTQHMEAQEADLLALQGEVDALVPVREEVHSLQQKLRRAEQQAQELRDHAEASRCSEDQLTSELRSTRTSLTMQLDRAEHECTRERQDALLYRAELDEVRSQAHTTACALDDERAKATYERAEVERLVARLSVARQAGSQAQRLRTEVSTYRTALETAREDAASAGNQLSLLNEAVNELQMHLQGAVVSRLQVEDSAIEDASRVEEVSRTSSWLQPDVDGLDWQLLIAKIKCEAAVAQSILERDWCRHVTDRADRADTIYSAGSPGSESALATQKEARRQLVNAEAPQSPVLTGSASQETINELGPSFLADTSRSGGHVDDRQLKALRDLVDAERARYSQARQDVAKLRGELEVAREATTEVDALRSKVDHLEATTHAAEQRAAWHAHEKEQECDALRSSLAVSRRECGVLRAEVDVVKRQFQESRAEYPPSFEASLNAEDPRAAQPSTGSPVRKSATERCPGSASADVMSSPGQAALEVDKLKRVNAELQERLQELSCQTSGAEQDGKVLAELLERERQKRRSLEEMQAKSSSFVELAESLLDHLQNSMQDQLTHPDLDPSVFAVTSLLETLADDAKPTANAQVVASLLEFKKIVRMMSDSRSELEAEARAREVAQHAVRRLQDQLSTAEGRLADYEASQRVSTTANRGRPPPHPDRSRGVRMGSLGSAPADQSTWDPGPLAANDLDATQRSERARSPVQWASSSMQQYSFRSPSPRRLVGTHVEDDIGVEELSRMLRAFENDFQVQASFKEGLVPGKYTFLGRHVRVWSSGGKLKVAEGTDVVGEPIEAFVIRFDS